MPSSRRASWILLPYILNEGCKRRARKDTHETQGDVSVRDQLYTTIFFPLNKHLQTAQATSHLFVSPQENLTLPPACLTGTNLLPFVGLTDTHTHNQQVFSTCFSVCSFYFRIWKRPTDPKVLPTMPASPRKKKSLLHQTSLYYIIRLTLIHHHY